jgi:oligopeptide transport system permease protein
MTGYIIRRLLWTIPVLLFISLVTFLLMHAVEGGPWDTGGRLTDTDRARLDARYGLDEPLWRQYLTYMENLVQGDLGVSLSRTTQDVRTIIWEGFKVSFVLGAAAMVLAAVIGLPLGILSAVKKNGPWDYLAVAISTIGASIPSFVLAIYLIALFSIELKWVPINGWGSPREAVLPVVVLAVFPLAYIARITRASVLEVLHEDYVRTARAKGLASGPILARHVMRNAFIPILTVSGPLAAAVVTGSYIVESMFRIPGVGRQFVDSFAGRDYGLIMGTTLFYAALIAVANLVVDVLAVLFDPRVRQS